MIIQSHRESVGGGNWQPVLLNPTRSSTGNEPVPETPSSSLKKNFEAVKKQGHKKFGP